MNYSIRNYARVHEILSFYYAICRTINLNFHEFSRFSCLDAFYLYYRLANFVLPNRIKDVSCLSDLRAKGVTGKSPRKTSIDSIMGYYNQ